MTNHRRTEKPSSELDEDRIAESRGTPDIAGLPPGSDAVASPTAEPGTPGKLTPDEQMALYEKDLKENDWGHQPC